MKRIHLQIDSLFLHEAIPGHHYQVSLQQEDTTMPKFRRFGRQKAYLEGWALYCESLGSELGLFKDPYSIWVRWEMKCTGPYV